MKRYAALAGAVCLTAQMIAPPLFAQSGPDITGRWTTQTEVQGIAVNETCDLKQSPDGTLTGTCDTAVGKYDLTGKVRGSSVNFTHPAGYQGQDMTVSFFGKLDSPTAISGSIDMQPINAGGAFAMTKLTK